MRIIDVLRKHAGKVCVCELVPLFDVSQPTLSHHHLKKLRDAGLVDYERQGLWAHYYVKPHALEPLGTWLGQQQLIDRRRSTGTLHRPTSMEDA